MFKKGEMSYSADAFSLRARNLFLHKMARARGVDLVGHMFPLPPFLETVCLRGRRKKKVDVLISFIRKEKIGLNKRKCAFAN